mgnify:CR=1 FL=1
MANACQSRCQPPPKCVRCGQKSAVAFSSTVLVDDLETKMKYNKGAILRSIEQPYLRNDLPDFDTGDTVRVDYKVVEGARTRVQAFEGVVIARKNGKGARSTITVRKVSFGEGVERVFPVNSPLIENIVVVRRGRTRRAKLYYLRELRGKASRLKTDVARQERDRAVARAAKADKE